MSWLDGERNAIHLMRLKDKLGNTSNASSEIEYQGALAHQLGDEGRGVQTIIEMVHHTRLDTAIGPVFAQPPALLGVEHIGEQHLLEHLIVHRAVEDRDKAFDPAIEVARHQIG